MRKRLVALLSLVGFANAAAPAASQVAKGSDSTPETRNESQVKGDKVKQEGATVQNDASKKARKAGGEQQAAQDVVNEKVGPDHVVHKHIAGVKYEKQKTEGNAGKTETTVKGGKTDAASKDAAKMTKVTTENTAIQDSQIKKVKTVSGESDAVKNDAGKKHRKVGAEQDALTVKQKTGIDAGTGKVKLEKNAAESNAVQQDANKKLQKQTDKASPK